MCEFQEELESLGFTVIDKIGEGGFARVFTTHWSSYPEKIFVLKIINVETEGRKFTVTNEINALQRLHCPNIINMFKYFEIKNNYCLVLEHCQNGTMDQYIKEKGKLTDENFVQAAYQCLLAIDECHRKKVAHLDIKPSNLLLDDYLRIKLIDFGLSQSIEDGVLIRNNFGSKLFCSPERLNGKYDPIKSDIWSLGITFYFFAIGKYPWNFIENLSPQEWLTSQEIIFPGTVNLCIKRLIIKMLSVLPRNRPTTETLLKCDIFDNCQEQIHINTTRLDSYTTDGNSSEQNTQEMNQTGELVKRADTMLRVNPILHKTLVCHKRSSLNQVKAPRFKQLIRAPNYRM